MSNLQLHMIQLSRSQAVITYSNVEIISWTSLTRRTNERTWPPQEKNAIQKCMRLQLITMIVTIHHCPVIIFDNQYIKSLNKRKQVLIM